MRQPDINETTLFSFNEHKVNTMWVILIIEHGVQYQIIEMAIIAFRCRMREFLFY